jgi:hypothetical protein
MQVGITHVEFTDYTHLDPFSPNPTPRSLMLHIRYPIATAAGLQQANYLPPASSAYVENLYGIPNGTIERLQTNAYLGGRLKLAMTTKDHEEASILVFSPGSGEPEASYSVVQEAMASYGYITIGVDHTYDSDPVEFPDGTLIHGILNDNNNTIAAIVRTQDVLAIARNTKPSNLSIWIDGFDDESGFDGARIRKLKFGIFGHSLGGDTATLAMQNSTKPYHACSSLDGPSHYNLLSSGFHGPFLFEGARLDVENLNSLGAIWANITGFKLAVGFQNTSHDDMTDLSVLIPQLPGTGVAARFQPLLANPDPAGLQKAMAVYLKAFWDFALRGLREEEILQHPVPQYPDVVFENPV